VLKIRYPKQLFILILLLSIFYTSNGISQNKTIKTTGDVILFVLPAATLATTFIIKDKKGSWQFTKAFLVNEAITHGLKYTIKKERPDGSNYNSFPSGHTSTTFQSASFIHLRYGFKYSIPAYVLAGFTAYSRIDANRHDGWDILGGAIIGVGSTLLFTTPYQEEHMELTYNSYDGNYLLGFNFKF